MRIDAISSAYLFSHKNNNPMGIVFGQANKKSSCKDESMRWNSFSQNLLFELRHYLQAKLNQLKKIDGTTAGFIVLFLLGKWKKSYLPTEVFTFALNGLLIFINWLHPLSVHNLRLAVERSLYTTSTATNHRINNYQKQLRYASSTNSIVNSRKPNRNIQYWVRFYILFSTSSLLYVINNDC